MEIYVIRHAAAGQHGDPRWPDDSQRPLTKKGILRFSRLVAKLARREFAPQIIATSPMVRCVQTARLVAEAVPGNPLVEEVSALLPGGNLDDLLQWTAKQSSDHSRIAWVGHAPDVSQLLGALIGARGAILGFAKGAIASVRFSDRLEPDAGELRWLITPKVVAD